MTAFKSHPVFLAPSLKALCKVCWLQTPQSKRWGKPPSCLPVVEFLNNLRLTFGRSIWDNFCWFYIFDSLFRLSSLSGPLLWHIHETGMLSSGCLTFLHRHNARLCPFAVFVFVYSMIHQKEKIGIMCCIIPSQAPLSSMGRYHVILLCMRSITS